MKNFKYLILILFTMVFMPLSVFASGSISPSPRSLTITKGGTATFTISANNAAGRVDIASSNGSVATVNKSSEWLENNSTTVTVTGVSAGTTTINVRLTDAATFDEEELSGNYTITVTVTETSQNNTNTNANINNNKTNNSNNNTNNLSKNNNIESLTITGYELNKIDANNYELSVSNNVTSIVIEGKPQDEKAKISGIGTKELQEGLNTFEVIVTSESGSQNKINVKVTRKDGYYLEDLSTVLNDSSLEDIGIIVDSDSHITEEELNEIQNSKKIVTFNFYDSEKKLIYTWTVDGSKINDAKGFNTNITFTSEYIKEIGVSSNYADGKYIHFEHDGELPSGTKIRLYVGDKFEDGNLVNIYYYNEENNNLETIKQSLTVTDGYVEFEIEHCSDYFVTMSTVRLASESASTTSSSIIYVVISIIELLLLVGLIVLDYFKLNPISKLKK